MDPLILQEARSGATSMGSRVPRSHILSLVALGAGAACLSVPTLLSVAHRSWSTEQGEYGLVALALGLYILVRDLWRLGPRFEATHSFGAYLIISIGALLYLLGRLSEEYLVETYGLFIVAVGVLSFFYGIGVLSKYWSQLLFVFLALPIPNALLIPLSSVLRQLIANGVVATFHASGVSVGIDGLSLFVDNHRIDVRQACSGMNSLVSLSLICLAYFHILQRPAWPYQLLMMAPVAASALIANFLRVVIVVLLTHRVGEAVAQGSLHELAGLVGFALALSLIIGLDGLFWTGRGDSD